MSAPRIFLVAGEASGDQLGAALMRALRAARPETVFAGVGGEAMAREGLVSLFPLEDIAVMGLVPVLARLPRLVRRIAQTARAVVDQAPDCLVIIDAPDFTHRVARRVRAARPDLPIINYVSPTVWAWRPGRAPAMREYVDCLLALLPFEPQAHVRLGGPRCVYVGHPLVERLDELTRPFQDRGARSLLVLPGSRLAEVRRMTPIYGEAVELLLRERADFEVAIPVAPNVEQTLLRELQGWPLTPRLVSQAEKFAAFRNARAALVTSGVATLELALAGVPMAVAYRISRAESLLRFLVKVESIVLPNLIIGENIVPEFLQEAATPRALAEALRPLLRESAAREAQLAAFQRVRARLLEAGRTPSARAADIILEYASRGRS
ncbi:lipid-A-disaccharide synthase [Methylocystis sp. SC2]|uniref:lipid-A-disaccharide synthase n=1 Tax=Methylocystis sp. (strain SC2) TaxID=187303 RepID=UPI00027AEA3F|nr:lipid-A-disaccharide synthase [Methylocystis sp. SC2]CCJ08597.1 Lipid-A-disaccharide synthase [Methylocystis sp. SC2]